MLLLLVLFYAGAFFSLMETALSESHRGRLERLEEEDPRAEAALDLLEHPEAPLSLAQAGITLTSILIGTLAGAFFAPYLSDRFLFIPHARGLAFLLCIAIVTLVALLACEFLPKRIALQKPERLLLRYGKLFSIATKLSSPFLSLFSKAAGLILLLIGINPDMRDTVTEDEVKELIEQGTEDGTFEKAEQAMVGRIFHLSDQTAYALMTPRTQMLWLDLADTWTENLKTIRENPQEVFPVGRESLDDFCGVVYSKDLLLAALSEKEIDLESHIKKPLFVPRSMESFRVLEKLRDSGLHEAIVLDEYGGVIGFITMDDLMREIIGESESHENQEQDTPQFTQNGKNSWSIDGLCSIDEFKDHFDIEELPDEAHDHYQTMGGFLMSYFGYIPKKGERCEWNGFTFEIARMDRARIDRILVTKTEDAPAVEIA